MSHPHEGKSKVTAITFMFVNGAEHTIYLRKKSELTDIRMANQGWYTFANTKINMSNVIKYWDHEEWL